MSPSSQEEIASQHMEAVRLVMQGMPCAPRQELGEMPSCDMQQPTFPNSVSSSSSSSFERGQEEKKEKEEDGSQQQQKQPPKCQTLKNPICFTTRGDVDVTKLQDLVREGYNLNYKHSNNNSMPPLSPTNYWDPRNAAKHNVTITRPSHDAWGIGKIVLVFCDDFMTKVYELPWWKEFKDALQPILDILSLDGDSNSNSSSSSSSDNNTNNNNNKSKRHLVRALLASLPPGVTIPVHHDTGEWVKWTHRVHVPILVKDPSKILFRCGPSPTTMQRIDCTPGHVFEINNQAKHAVSNCDDDDDDNSRVHLILDYVVVEEHQAEDESTATTAQGEAETTMTIPTIPKRIVLDPGEGLVQTRRSIDRVKDQMKRPPPPSYIILGAQKAGTTSLYEYICQHPWVVKARRRETHCLDWRWNDDLKTPALQLEWCHKFFHVEGLKQYPSCLTGDSTPSYLLDSRRVIPRIQSVFDWKLQYFCMLRDPVKRTLSHYAMVTSLSGTPAQLKTRGSEWRGMNFRQVVESELEMMHDCGLIPYWNIDEGSLDEDLFNSFTGSSEEDKAWDLYLELHVPLNTGSYGLLTRGMYALQLRPWLRAFDRDQFCVLKLESMKSNVQGTMRKVWAHLDLPNHPVEDEEAKNTREYQPMEFTMKAYLERFFEPHNRQLSKVLEDTTGEWDDPWPYNK